MRAAVSLFTAAAVALAADFDAQALLQIDPSQAVALESLNLDERVISGGYGPVTYKASKILGEIVLISFTGPSLNVNVNVDCTNGTVKILGNGSYLTTESAKFLNDIHSGLEYKLLMSPDLAWCAPVKLLSVSMGFLAKHPTDVPIGIFHGESSNVKCLKPNKKATALWSDKAGSHKRDVVTGTKLDDWACVGHCGAGCSKEYSQDCLNHAVCCAANPEGGCFGGVCGDEYQATIDDHFFVASACGNGTNQTSGPTLAPRVEPHRR